MDKQDDNRRPRSKWKEDNRHLRLYDEKSDRQGQKSSTGDDKSSRKNDIASNLNQNLPEDMRISKLLKRLETESTTTGFIGICEKLKVVVQDPANSTFIRRKFDDLANSVIDIMKNCSVEALPHMSEIFGLLGFVKKDFQIYKSFIRKTFKSTKSLRPAMMNALEKTLRMDQSRELDNQVRILMELLRDFFEQEESSESFVAILQVLVVIAQNYLRHFRTHFTNVVDVVIGWSIHPKSNKTVKRECSAALQTFQKCWDDDQTFSFNMMKNLSDDINEKLEKVTSNVDDDKERKKIWVEFGRLIGVYTVVMKCVMHSESLTYGSAENCMETYQIIIDAAKTSLSESCNEELVLSINEYILIMFVYHRQQNIEMEMHDIQQIIESQLDGLRNYSSDALASFFTILIKFIDEFKANLQPHLIVKLFDINGPLTNEIRFNDDKRVKNGLIQLYHEILSVKIVPILQTSFKYIVADLQSCLREIPQLNQFMWYQSDVEMSIEPPENTKISISKAQYSLNFNLVALSKLATMQNSIIVMYSLSPSILEVLINFQIWESEWSEYEIIQFAILKLIASHCMKNNNFVSSSSLFIDKTQNQPTNSWLSNSSPTESPVSNHFKLILDFLEKLMKATPTLQQFKIIVDWIDKIVQQTSQFSEQLYQNQQFVYIVKRMNEIAANFNDEISLKVANCDDALSRAFDSLHPDIFTSMAELCCVQLCSVNPEIRKRYSFILSRVPLRFTLEQAKSPSGINKDSMLKTSEMENWHLSLGALHGGELRAQYFQEFINHITFSPEATDIDDFILRAFKNCWFIGTEKAEEYKKVTLKDIRMLTSWIQWEAARYCVNNKLRTPLGKAQDTIIKIENIIKQYARILALQDHSKVKSYKNVLANQRNVRILLGFMESLEKAIYNAAEGNSFGIPPPEKPAKTFFRTNYATCNEWFTRNRLALHLIALHSMELEMVIRCSTSVLKDMAAAGKFHDVYFDQILVSLVWAFLRNFESDALFGLYTWVKHVSGRKLLWIKMVAEQACGHREIAAEGYSKILKDEKFDSQIFDFINDQRKICLMFSGNFEPLLKICRDEENEMFKPKNVPILTTTADQVSTILQYDKTRDTSVILEDLSLWETLEVGSEVCNNFSVHKLLSLSENTQSLTFIGGEHYQEQKQEACWEIFHTLLQECLRTNSQEYLIYFNFMNHLSHKGVSLQEADGIKNIESFEIKKKFGAITMYMVSAWSEYIDAQSKKGEQQAIDLRLDLISCARKELNYLQCNRELKRSYEKIEYAEHVGLPVENTTTLNAIKQFLMQSRENAMIWSENVTRAVYEHCKIIYIAENEHQNAIQFAASTSWAIENRLKSKEFEVKSEKLQKNCVKFNLKISEWIQNENDDSIKQKLQTFSPLKLLTDDINPNDYYVDENMPLVDAAVGKLLQSGTKKCPEMTKVWLALGGWCYRWGRKMVESKTDSHGLQPVERNAIVELLPNASRDDVESILKILNEQQAIAEDEDIGPNELSCTELIESQLRLIPSLKDKNMKFMNLMIDLWKNAHREVYRYYEMCASSYFKFLLLSSTENDTKEDSSSVTATLRLLRLIVKHALSLQEVLEEGLSNTPSDPWKVIIPQLFSRLNHHEPYVRRRVSELLCRVAIDSPHLIIFPTVVGAQETVLDVINIAKEDHEKCSDVEHKNSGLTFCFNSLLESLTLKSPKTVNQVQLLVRELRRIAILWDELWVMSLSQVYADNIKRFQLFNSEWQKADQPTDKIFLFTEKYRLLMRPVLFVLERLQEWTMRSAETNNERLFQKMYSKVIEITINEMRKPFDPNEPLAGFNKFKSLYQLIQQRVQRKINHTMEMSDISPELANLHNTVISMPGVQPLHEHEAVYIQSVDNSVQILPTKTKPKKLAFIGSDGKRYTYLFKGMEDLHLDERIMQFLSIANLMMKDSIDSDGKITHYRAHHYSVIPLGPRSGLISWVDGVTPIFSIYKKWQQREAANPRKDKQFTVMRPSEMYYSKITPLLKEHNIKPTDNRRDWPLSVQRKVFEDLKAETPKDLLAKEFWCTASTAAHWRQIIRNYSVSLAVMSVIGSIIGLGDRHLDNILIKLSTGDVVHIDYNVCFEKGKTLRVPEKVPFRMTQNIEEALGLTGIEGTFRLSCEHVLKSLKRGRETLLTLLEAFVYDPLVDWAVGEDSTTSTAGSLANFNTSTSTEKGATHLTAACKQLEREVTRDTLAIHFTEMRTEWMQNRDDIYNQLLLMKTHLNDLSSNRADILRFETQRIIRSKQISLVRELEALGSAMSSHPLNTLSQRYAICKRKRNDVEMMRNILNQKVVELERVMEDYKKCRNDINYGKLAKINLEDVESNYRKISEFNLIKDFLESTAQGQVYVKCELLQNELFQSLYCQQQVLIEAIQLITKYGEAVEFYPQNHLENHRLTKFSIWYRYVMENNSIESSSSSTTKHIMADFRSIFADRVNECNPENVASVFFHLQTYLSELSYQKDVCLSNLYQLQNQTNPNDDQQTFSDLRQEFHDFMYQTQSHSISSDEHFNPSIHDLCKLTRRMMTVELQISSKNQETLTTDLMINNRWHLDEVRIQMTFLNNLIDISTKSNRNPAMSHLIEYFGTLTDTVEAFHSSQTSFYYEIIPLTLKSIITEDQSTMSMISKLNKILKPELIEILNQDLHNPQNHGEMRAQSVIEGYELLVKEYLESNDDCLGKNVFLSMNSLFDEITKNSTKIIAKQNIIAISNEWRNLVELNQVKNIITTSLDSPAAVSTLTQIFLIEKIQTMIDFFSICLEITLSLKGSGGMLNLEQELLSRPLKKFICHYYTKFILGRVSLCLSKIICCLCGERKFDNLLSFDQIRMNVPGNKITEKYFKSLEEKLRTEEFMEFTQNSVNKIDNFIGQIGTLLNSYCWIHEDILALSPAIAPQIQQRHLLLIQLQSVIQTLSSWKSSIAKIDEELEQSRVIVLQRLKWAAGANPSVNDSMIHFESISKAKAVQLENDKKIADEVMRSCCAVLNYEMMRFQHPNAMLSDEEFLKLLKQWESARNGVKSVANTINPIEESLVELLDPEGNVDRDWIEKVTSLIDDIIHKAHSDIDLREKNVVLARDNLDECAHKLRNFITTHHRISVDVKNLLKSLLKQDESERMKELQEYFSKYKTFMENITELHGNVLSKDFTDTLVKKTSALVDDSLSVINHIYDDLFKFEKTINSFASAVHTFGSKMDQLQQASDVPGSAGSPFKKASSTTHKEQKRNAYAVSVWRRIRMKLEGRDPDPNKTSRVQEQIDWMIKEATNQDNLALLYEGFTAWV